MTVIEFADAVVAIRRRYGGWVTSWGRTDRHSEAVGGFAGDPHTWDLGVDMQYDVMPEFEALKSEAFKLGLKVIRDLRKWHDHFQPYDFPAGVVKEYETKETKTWG